LDDSRRYNPGIGPIVRLGITHLFYFGPEHRWSRPRAIVGLRGAMVRAP
jgi:hypothetical protein